MGGAGKTTTVRAIFDHLFDHFEAISFIENVREVLNVAGLKKLQEQVLSDVLNEQVTLNGVFDGIKMMRKRMCCKRVLLVLDDVDHIEQLKEATSLFSRHAFGRENPLQGYKELSGKVIRYAAGLLLTIEVLGSFLFGKDKLEWVDAIDRLQKIPLKNTLEKLELSYMSLEDEYKEIFQEMYAY
ncbi:Toll/interleukin-1 receptor domain-containing protein [Tanacetum coccineum]